MGRQWRYNGHVRAPAFETAAGGILQVILKNISSFFLTNATLFSHSDSPQLHRGAPLKFKARRALFMHVFYTRHATKWAHMDAFKHSYALVRPSVHVCLRSVHIGKYTCCRYINTHTNTRKDYCLSTVPHLERSRDRGSERARSPTY